MYSKNLNHFTFIKNLEPETNTSFSHPLALYQKIKTNSQWFVKATKTYPETVEEVVAQEFFRLILPSHPKTRWIKKKANWSSRYAKLFCHF